MPATGVVVSVELRLRATVEGKAKVMARVLVLPSIIDMVDMTWLWLLLCFGSGSGWGYGYDN